MEQEFLSYQLQTIKNQEFLKTNAIKVQKDTTITKHQLNIQRKYYFANHNISTVLEKELLDNINQIGKDASLELKSTPHLKKIKP